MLITSYGINIGGSKIRRDGLWELKKNHILHTWRGSLKQRKHRPIKVFPEHHRKNIQINPWDMIVYTGFPPGNRKIVLLSFSLSLSLSLSTK